MRQKMKLSKEALDEFKKIYQREHKRPLTNQEARELGIKLLGLMEIIYRPIPKEDGKNQ